MGKKNKASEYKVIAYLSVEGREPKLFDECTAEEKQKFSDEARRKIGETFSEIYSNDIDKFFNEFLPLYPELTDVLKTKGVI